MTKLRLSASPYLQSVIPAYSDKKVHLGQSTLFLTRVRQRQIYISNFNKDESSSQLRSLLKSAYADTKSRLAVLISCVLPASFPSIKHLSPSVEAEFKSAHLAVIC